MAGEFKTVKTNDQNNIVAELETDLQCRGSTPHSPDKMLKNPLDPIKAMDGQTKKCNGYLA